MALRFHRLAYRSWPSLQTATTRFTSRRPFSQHTIAVQTRFTFVSPAGDSIKRDELFTSLREAPAIANPQRHDAAVILVTPGLVKYLEDDAFMSEVANALSASAEVNRFHILSAVVDQIAPVLGSYTPLQGISVLRGHLNDMLPYLWEPSAPRAMEDADRVSALTFNMGDPSITLPLARTTFQNHKTSTLLTSCFDMSTKATPKLAQQTEKSLQHVNVKVENSSRPQSTADLGLWAPLTPLTHARLVTESFGNIIRGVEVGHKPVPASTELEAAVNNAFEQASEDEAVQGPVGVWALVTPKSCPIGDSPNPVEGFLKNTESQKEIAQLTRRYIERSYQEGARLYKILSGGGGWGPKKGLLSLDPQRTHFALSDEEEMQRFLQTMDNSGFAPIGSSIQFFASPRTSPNVEEKFVPGVVFGVSGLTSASTGRGQSNTGYIGQHFGALSNDGLFITGLVQSKPSTDNTIDESKLSVPGSRIYLSEEGEGAGAPGSDPASALADAGVAAML